MFPLLSFDCSARDENGLNRAVSLSFAFQTPHLPGGQSQRRAETCARDRVDKSTHQLSFLRGWISPIFELIVRVAKHSTHRQRSQRFQVHLTRPFLVVLQIEVVRVQNRVRRDQRFVRYIIAERAGQNERQSCMFTSYIRRRRRRRSTKGSVILRIDVDDIECYILLSGRLLLRDTISLTSLERRFGVVRVRLRVSQEDPIEDLDGAFSLLRF